MEKMDGRTREGRAAREQQARRRRTDNLAEARFNLSFVGEKDPAYEYRWINDHDLRMHQKTVADDWDVVRQDQGIVKEDGASLGTEVAHVVGTKKDGSPLRAVLCRKPKEYCAEDRKRAEVQRAEMDEQIRRGAIAHPQGGVGPQFYTPNTGRNSVG